GGAGFGAPATGAPPLFAQGFGPGSPGQGFPGSGFPGRPGGSTGSGLAQQGGALPRGGVFSLEPAATAQLTAFCTDLLGDAPDGASRFVGGGPGQVALANGSTEGLAQAI